MMQKKIRIFIQMLALSIFCMAAGAAAETEVQETEKTETQTSDTEAADTPDYLADFTLTEDTGDILELVKQYYEALDSQDDFMLSRLVAPWNESVREKLHEKSAEGGHHNIRVWYSRLPKDAYVIFTYFEVYDDPDNPAAYSAQLLAMYLVPDETGALVIGSGAQEHQEILDMVKQAAATPQVQELVEQIKGEETETEAPQTEETETEAPETETPETEVHETEIPETEAPQTEAPVTEPPQSEAPETQAPQSEAPKMEAPQSEAPQTEYQDPKKEYIFWDSDQRYLTDEEINRLSLQAMNYAKNEVYARRGRKFLSVELQEYFGSKSWYNGYIEAGSFSETVFNEYELYNAHHINELETQRAGSPDGYPLNQPGYDIHAVGTASYDKTEGNTGGLYVGDNGEVAVG